MYISLSDKGILKHVMYYNVKENTHKQEQNKFQTFAGKVDPIGFTA